MNSTEGPPENGVQGRRQAIRNIVAVTLPNGESRTIVRVLDRTGNVGAESTTMVVVEGVGDLLL